MYDTGIRPEKMRSVPKTSLAPTQRAFDGIGIGGMALQSMTGFARAGAELDGVAIAWEVKSVNGKGIEARFRLAPGFERIEQPARQAIQRRFSRGNLQATLTVVHVALTTQPVVNEDFLKDLAGLARRLVDQFGVTPGQRRRAAGAARRA